MYRKAKIIRRIRESLSQGTGIYKACEAAGITYGTFWRWKNASKRIERYIDKVLLQRVQLVEDALYKNALKGNTTAQIFFLKNRGKDWNDTPLIDMSNHELHITKVEVIISDDTKIPLAHETGNRLPQQK